MVKKNTRKTWISSISVSGQWSYLGPSGTEQEEGERGKILYSLSTSTLGSSTSRPMIDEQWSLSIELISCKGQHLDSCLMSIGPGDEAEEGLGGIQNPARRHPGQLEEEAGRFNC